MENETNPGARNDDPCYYERPPMVEVRFWLVTVFGSSISLTSVLFNVFLFYLFASRRHHRSGQNVYLMLLAFFDVFVSGAYVALMSVNVLADYLVEPRLIKFWFSYMVPTITISHIAMTSSSFLIVAATFERYTITTNSALLGFAQRNRILIGGCAIALGLISKGSIFFEFDIHVEKECTGQMTEVAIGLHPFVHGTSYHVIWRFWYRNFVTVFAPFLVLSYFNICIVRSLSKQQCVNVTAQLAGNFAIEQAKRKASARAATRTMVAVVSCYLGSNIINVLLTVWEHVDKDSLSSQYVNVYAISVDCVSLLTTLACAMRLPIYIICQPALRLN